MSNPLQDPAIIRAQSPTMATTLDPNRIPSYAPQVRQGPASPVLQGQHQYPTNGAASPPINITRINLIDEIGTSIKSAKSSTILRVMRISNLLLSALTIAVGILAWLAGRVNTFQKVIAGIYIILFGALLLVFELRTQQLDRLLRSNFGFMYDNSTRTVFLLFVAIWPLSMGNFWLTILDAALLFVNAFFNYYVVSRHPAFTAAQVIYVNAPNATPATQTVSADAKV